GFTGRRMGAGALAFAVGLLVLAMVAITLLSVASPQPVSQSDAPSAAPTAEVAASNQPSDVPSQSLAPSTEPSPSVSPSAQATSSQPSAEPTFDWASTGYRVVFDSSVYESDVMEV